MKVEIWFIGKTNEKYLQIGTDIFSKRLKRYIPCSVSELPDVKSKNRDAHYLKLEEGKMILSKIASEDYLVLLDEHGQHFTSVELAHWVEKKLGTSYRRLVFLVGGAYGFSDEMLVRANEKISLSKLTFSHQMVRLFLLEQLYRAMTILKNEPYHNE